MTKMFTIIAAGLAVLLLIIASVSGTDTATAASAMDRCLPCHPRAHVDGWRESHAGALKVDPEEKTVCTSCHPTSFCVDCHQQSAANGTYSGPATGNQYPTTQSGQ